MDIDNKDVEISNIKNDGFFYGNPEIQAEIERLLGESLDTVIKTYIESLVSKKDDTNELPMKSRIASMLIIEMFSGRNKVNRDAILRGYFDRYTERSRGYSFAELW
jgi:hypothetical protein